MKIRNALIAVFVLVAVSANAQQRPEPIDNTDANAQNQHKIPIIKHFPCTAAEYDKFIKWEMGMLQTTAARFPEMHAEFNKVVLRVRDCTSMVEADGYVTQSEFQFCDRRLEETIREIKRSYQLSHQ